MNEAEKELQYREYLKRYRSCRTNGTKGAFGKPKWKRDNKRDWNPIARQLAA